MALASKETLDQIKRNSAFFLTECEPLLRTVSELRIKLNQVRSDTSKELDLAERIVQNAIDVILCDSQILFDAVSSLRFLLNSEDGYAKRFGMQCINLCFCESVGFWKQDEKDCKGHLIQLRNYCEEINLLGHYHLLCHVLDDINAFESSYVKNKDLRNSFRHRSDIQKLYMQQVTLDDEDFFAKGVCGLIDIYLQLSVVCTQLLGLSFKVDRAFSEHVEDTSTPKNKLFLKCFSGEGLISNINSAIASCVRNIDSSYECVLMVDKAEEYLPKDGKISKQFRDLVLIQMHTNYLAADVLCAVRGFLQAKNDFERAQNLRLIYICKQACLTQLYGYNNKARSKSLWTSIVGMNVTDDLTDVRKTTEDQLSKLTKDLEEDRKKSNRSAHYVHNKAFYVPDRIEAIKSLDYEKEISDALSLIRLCKTINHFTEKIVSKKNVEETAKLQKTLLRLSSFWDELNNHIAEDNGARLKTSNLQDFVSQILSL